MPAQPLPPLSPAARARERAGLSVEQAACRVGVSADYLRRLEASGGFSYPLACRMAAACRCGVEPFLFTKSQNERRSAGKAKGKTAIQARGSGRKSSSGPKIRT